MIILVLLHCEYFICWQGLQMTFYYKFVYLKLVVGCCL